MVANLVKNNIRPDNLLAIVEQATTPLQNVHITSLYDYDTNFKGRIFASPSLVIIGKVVALHHKFAWLPNSESSDTYFKPVQPNTKLINTLTNVGG